MLEKLEPQVVFHYFEEICSIPHGSGNTKQISDYLKQFAEEQGLYCRQDEWNNIVIVKEATAGYEEHEPVILQGHMDMVAVKDEDYLKDLRTSGLELYVKDGMISAKGTSLGGDDGIAIAMALALLAGKDYQHPRIEFVATVDEEVGMEGASHLSVEDLTAKRMINLDQEEEQVFIAGCAGGARVDIEKFTETEDQEGILCKLKIAGFQGGHSGQEIDKERGNAICLMGRILAELQTRVVVFLKELQGGVADNAIPSECSAVLVLREQESEKGVPGSFQKWIREFLEGILLELKEELQDREAGMSWQLELIDDSRKIEEAGCRYEVCSQKESGQWIHLLNVMMHGVIANSMKMPGLVETSLNPGMVKITSERGCVTISVRSSKAASKQALIGRLQSLAMLAEASVSVRGDYPGWDYHPDSGLCAKMVVLYREMYGETPKVEAIHAGLECGIFMSKIKDLDCISIGPDMTDIHTTRECLSVSSVQRIWEYLLRLLADL